MKKFAWIAAALIAVGIVVLLSLGRGDRGGSSAGDESTSTASVPIAAPVESNSNSDRATRAAASRGSDEGATGPVAGTLTIRARVIERGLSAGVPEATISWYHDPSDRLAEPTNRTKTDTLGAGEYQIAPGAKPSILLAVVEAPNYERLVQVIWEEGAPSSSPLDVDFQLGPEEFINGRVYDEAGLPVPGARVGRLLATKLPLTLDVDPNRAFPEIESSPEGTFELRGLSKSDPTRLVVMKYGFKPWYSELLPPGTRNLEVVIRRGQAAIEGFVQDAAGEPLKNVPVRVWYRPTGPGFRPPTTRFPNPDLQFARTDKTGYYEFAALDAGWQSVIAEVATPRRQSVGDSVLLVEGDKRQLNLRFSPPLAVAGVIVDAETKSPIQGVRFSPPGATVIRGNAPAQPGEVITGPDGRFKLDAVPVETNGFLTVPPLKYLLPATYGIDAEDWREERLQLTALETGRELRIEVSRSVLVEGVVMEADLAKPAANVGVDFVIFGGRGGPPTLPPQDHLKAAVVTGATGTFRLKVPPNSRGAVYARRPGATAYELITVAAEPPESLTLTLRPMISISGTVTDPAGQPLQGMEVTFAQLTQAASLFGDIRTLTDATGSFRREGLTPDRVTLNVVAVPGSNMIPPPPLALEPTADMEGVNLQMVQGVPIEGLVVNQDAAPVAGALISIRPNGRGGWGGPGGAGNRGLEATSGADGTFVIYVEPDRAGFRLTAAHPSYDTKTLLDLYPDDSSLTIILLPRAKALLTAYQGGQQLTSFEYEFTLERGTGGENSRRSVDGKVFDQVGPVSEALSAGTYRAHVYTIGADQKRNGGYGFSVFTLPEGVAEPVEVRVDVADSIVVRGRVIDEAEIPVVDARVTLTQEDEQRGRGGNPVATTGKAGEFEFTFARPGRIRLRAEFDGMAQKDGVEATLVAGEQPEPFTIIMSNRSTIFGNVLDHRGDPTRDVRIHVDRIQGGGTRPDLDGNYEIADVRPGQRNVILTTESGSRILSEQVSVPSGERKEVNFDLTGRVMLQGEVRRNGTRVEDNRFRLRLLAPKGTEGGIEQELVATRGEFTQFVYPGSFEVAVGSDGGWMRTGVKLDITAEPFEQEATISLELLSVGVVILTPPGEFRNAEVRIRRRTAEGDRDENRTIRAESARFFLDNELPGELRGDFTAADGTRYLSDWTPIGPSEENIITLLPEDI